MKKYIALLLALILLLSAAVTLSSCNKPQEADAETDNSDQQSPNKFDDDGIMIQPKAPGSSSFVSRKLIEIDGEPVLENGKLIIHFTSPVSEDSLKDCYVGLCQRNSAESLKASFDLDTMAEFKTEEGYSAVVIVTDEAIEPGSYEFYVSFGSLIVPTFTMDV